jgi:hypothetical protein
LKLDVQTMLNSIEEKNEQIKLTKEKLNEKEYEHDMDDMEIDDDTGEMKQ